MATADNLPLATGIPEWRDSDFDVIVNEVEAGLTLMGQPLDAAEALASDRDAYLTALEEWREKVRAELDRSVLETFPGPIAQYYWRFRRGDQGHLERLSAARDTFEALVHILHGLVLAELRAVGAQVPPHTARRPWVDSQNLRDRVELIRQVVLWETESLPLCGQISTDLLNDLELLIHFRNNLAHLAQPTVSQAEEWLRQLVPVLQRALLTCAWLGDLVFVQPLRGQLRAFRGHSSEIQYLPRKLDKSQRVALAERESAEAEVFVLTDTQLYSLHPVVIPHSSADTHQAHLAFLKQRKGGNLTYEVFGRATELTFEEPECLAELNELKQRFIND